MATDPAWQPSGAAGNPSAARSAARDPLALVEAFEAAWNAQDAEAVLRFFADDAVVRFRPPPPPPGRDLYVGRRQVREFVESQLAGPFHATSRDRRARPDGATWMATASMEPFRRAGVDPVEARGQVTLRDGKIASFHLILTPATLRRLESAAMDRARVADLVPGFR